MPMLTPGLLLATAHPVPILASPLTHQLLKPQEVLRSHYYNCLFILSVHTAPHVLNNSFESRSILA